MNAYNPHASACTDGAAFCAEQHGQTILIHFKRHLIQHFRQLHEKNELLAFLLSLESRDDVKTVILVGNPEKRGLSEYNEWTDDMRNCDDTNREVARLLNAFHQILHSIIKSAKIYFYADSGNITYPLFSIGLACDYRVLCENAVLQNTCALHNVLPLGGIPFFLMRKVGRGHALEALLFKQSISATEAFEWGMVEKIAPADKLTSITLEMADALNQRPARFLSSVKHALSQSLRDFEEYLDMESKEVSSDFSQ